MTYFEFRDRIERRLRKNPRGLSWKALRDQLALPYERACPEWTKRLEHEIGLKRVRREGPALIWTLPPKT